MSLKLLNTGPALFTHIKSVFRQPNAVLRCVTKCTLLSYKTCYCSTVAEILLFTCVCFRSVFACMFNEGTGVDTHNSQRLCLRSQINIGRIIILHNDSEFPHGKQRVKVKVLQ